ncbi:GDSL family lipase [Pedobacter petrophilus]|uniref:GDSL family lipase n=1 Tax=Pedobacter petrophilus TaxID=1908241 RepID=A0A7K0FYX5_9SPHI|nr:SGNH/GDSL hydrolase family protein [Pedobacter petrophilus]MRX76787.1 GDSL family lipase [Pedobacter petrophilus]
MKLKIFSLLVLSFFSLHSASAISLNKGTDTLYAPALKPFGRTIINAAKKLELISSAAHFGFKFSGDSCVIFADVPDTRAHNYLQYEMDGVYQNRIRIEGKKPDPITIKATGKGEHTIWIYKATEAHTGAILIGNIVAKKVRAITVAKAPLIEFIGNSITCGAAADDSEYPCGTGDYHDQHNAYLAYGPRVARKLGANYLMSSVSGIGIYRVWNADGPAMPDVYENLDFHLGSKQKWDFKTYSPKIVSIALGTNDFSNGDGKSVRKPFDNELFVKRYVDFIKLIKSKYPKAQIALLSSPMVKGAQRDVFEKLLTDIKNQVDSRYPKDKEVKTFFFQPMDPHGCSSHPSVADHQILADELYPFYQAMLR